MPRPALRAGLTVGIAHLLLTLALGWLTLLARIEEVEQGFPAPTLMTEALMALLGLLTLPAGALVPRLLAPSQAEALVWLILPLNSALWGLTAALLVRWWWRRTGN